AKALLEMGKADDAAAVLKSSDLTASFPADAAVIQGGIAALKGDTDTAIKNIRKALALQPDLVRVLPHKSDFARFRGGREWEELFPNDIVQTQPAASASAPSAPTTPAATEPAGIT